MVGPGGNFFRAEDGGTTLEPAQALVELHAAGIPLVLVSGRTRAQLVEACAIFGADGYIAELGALLGWNFRRSDGGPKGRLLRGAMPEQCSRIPEEIVDALLAREADRLEFHDPWHLGHEIDVMFRGQVDVVEVEKWLADQGHGWLRLRDNGVLPRQRSKLPVSAVHVYHLVPAGIGKGLAVAEDLRRRGLAAADAVAIGDSASDLAMADSVGRFHLVANGVRPPHMPPLVADCGNVVVEKAAYGAGWASAVRSALTS
jgi:hypothetical protein